MRIPLSDAHQTTPGVRARLAALVLACVLPLASISAFVIENFYANARQQLIDNTRARVRAISASLDREFDNTTVALQALGTSRMLAVGDLQGFHARARSALLNMNADSIVVVGTDGALLMSTRRDHGQPLPILRRTPLLLRILENGKPGVSDLFLGPIVGTYIYTVGVPIQRADQSLVTLNATATHTQLARVLSLHGLPESWRAAIVDRNGLVAARSHAIGTFLGKPIPPQIKSSLAELGEGTLESRTLDGIRVFTVFHRSPTSGWATIVGIPLDELTAGLERSLSWLIVATLAALGAGLLLSWRIGGRIASSVQALVAPAHAMGQHASVSILPLYFREANQLGEAMARAGADLHSTRAAGRESEQRLALAARAARLGVWERDCRSEVMWISDEWRALFAFDPLQKVDMEQFMLRIHGEDRPAVLAMLNEAIANVHPYQTEYRIELPDGTVRWISSQGDVDSGSNGQARLLRGVSLDITRRKQVELDVRQRQKEVTHLARVAMMGELTGAMAHELNQPLTAILSNAQAAVRYLARTPPQLDQVRAILKDIVSEDERAGAIIERLRRLFDKHELPCQALDIDTLITEVARILHNDLINHSVLLRIERGSPGAMVDGDPVQLQQVLINLIINACDAMGESTHEQATIVLSSAFASAGNVVISICDSGSGIEDAAMARLFEAFFTTKERGMGLGLSICRNIVLAHGGELWASNNDGAGATFFLSLPLRKADHVA